MNLEIHGHPDPATLGNITLLGRDETHRFTAFSAALSSYPLRSDIYSISYNRYLRNHGLCGRDPWQGWAITADDEHGEILSNWKMRHANLPARIPRQHSESVYTTTRAIGFIAEQGEKFWVTSLVHQNAQACAVLNSYHALYSTKSILQAIRTKPLEASKHRHAMLFAPG